MTMPLCLAGSSRTRRGQESISTELLGCGQVSGPPNYSDEDEKDRCRDTGGRAGRRSTGQQADSWLRLAGKYRDPLSNFQELGVLGCTGQTRPVTKEGGRTELAWTGFIFSQLPAAHLLLSTSPFLPATGIPSFLPFPFSSSIHLHSIHQRTLASLISQTFKMSPNDNVKVLGMPVSTQCLHPPFPQEKIPSPQTSRGKPHRELRNAQRHPHDPRQHCQCLEDDALLLLEMAVCLVPAVWPWLWLIAPPEKLCPPAM